MVGILSGNQLGLFNTQVPSNAGNADTGQTKGSAYVNIASGNLVLQFLDESLSATGADIRHLRTYNSLGTTSDGDGDRCGVRGLLRAASIGACCSPRD